MANGLEVPHLAELDWAPQARAESLLAVYRHAVGLAVEAEEWYRRKRPRKARWGRALRVGAIVLGAVAVILPVLAEISTTNSRPAIAPGWAAIALAAAATLIGLDHFFGFSSGWMRFMTAELNLTRLRHEFEYAWSARRATAESPPTPEQILGFVELARTLVLAVDDVIAEETGGWVAEFRGSLDRTEQTLARGEGR